MANEIFEEVSEILTYIMENNTVPRNIRRVAEESKDILSNEDEDVTVRASTVIIKL